MELLVSVLILAALVGLTAFGFKFLFIPKQIAVDEVAKLDSFDTMLVKKYDAVNIHKNRAYTLIAGLAVTTIFTIVLTEILFQKEVEVFEQIELGDLAEETYEIPPTTIPPPPPPPKPKSVVVTEAPEELIEPEIEDSLPPEPDEEEEFDFDAEEDEDIDEEEDVEEIKVAPSIWTTTEIMAQPTEGVFPFIMKLRMSMVPKISALGSYLNDVNPGVVVLQFVVNENGSVSNVVAAQKLDPKIDQIVIGEFKKLAKYSPGMNQGQAVKSYMTLPVEVAFE